MINSAMTNVLSVVNAVDKVYQSSMDWKYVDLGRLKCPLNAKMMA
jgi:hypothetical protein